MTLPPLLLPVLTESAELLVSTVEMTILVALLTVAIIFVGCFFSSDLPVPGNYDKQQQSVTRR